MDEKKNKSRAILLVVLILITSVVYWLSLSKKDNTVERDMFRLADYGAIDRVVLESPNHIVELTFNGTRWRVNNRYNADPTLVTVLFETLRQAEPKRPVASSVQDSVSAALEETGVKISLFSGQSPKQRLIAGGNTFKNQAYFKKPGQDNVYLVNIPGYRVYVSGIFELTENQWREKNVFGFNWRNFQRLEAKFPGKPTENFTVAPQNDMFGVEGIKTDTTRLARFMDRVLALSVDEYLAPGKFTDSLIKAQPVMVLTISDVSKKEYSLALFEENRNQVPGLIDGEQGIIFNRLKIQPILRPKSYFRAK